MNAIAKWIRGWTVGEFAVFTAAVVFVWSLRFADAFNPAPQWLHPLMWASLIAWFLVAWQWVGKKRND